MRMQLSNYEKINILNPGVKEEMRGNIIDEIFDGSLHTFLRRNSEYHNYELIYSKIFKKWVEDKTKNRAIRWIKRKLEHPNNIKGVINILRTLYGYYDYDIDVGSMKIAYKIWELFDDEYIYDYNYKRYMKRMERYRRALPAYMVLNPKTALKEQKARGFIHVNDFEDYDKIASHVWSSVDKNYLWPANCAHGIIGKEKGHKDIYIMQHCVGVGNWTRCQIPKY